VCKRLIITVAYKNVIMNKIFITFSECFSVAALELTFSMDKLNKCLYTHVSFNTNLYILSQNVCTLETSFFYSYPCDMIWNQKVAIKDAGFWIYF
jgi:hypothetical protein